MIHELEVGEDKAGFPIVSWREDRGAGSPAGNGRFRMECRIARHASSGVLLFVARGHMRNRAFEAGRPWEALQSFGYHSAMHRYLTPLELQMREHLLAKTRAGRVLMGDGGKAFLAEFSGDVFFDLACPEAAQVDLDRLQKALERAFVTQRETLVGERCRVMYHWPADDDRLETYDPKRTGWPGERDRSALLDALGWLAALAIVAGIGAAMYGLLL